MKSDIKLFGKWDFNVEVVDAGLQSYINLEPVYAPHTGGRHAKKRFWKAEKVPIVERLINKIMRSGQGTKKFSGKYIRSGGATGKKALATRIVEDVFDIIAQRTGKNPLQVLVDALQQAAPREETTTIIYGGVHYHKAVDIAPQRRIDLALRNLVVAAYANSFNNPATISATLADEIIHASANDTKSYAIKKKEEVERIARSSR